MTSYLFDNAWQQARQRLAALEAWLDPGTIRLLATLGVGEGWRCLEVGAGGGSIAAWLGERVGPRGHVLATDIDTRFLEPLTAPNLEVRRHDLARDALPEGAFDLVHARAVLEHLPERDHALQRLAAALRPGGWLLVEDGDFTTLLPAPGGDAAAVALVGKVWAAIRPVRAARGATDDYGRRLFGAVRALGLVDLGAEGRVAVAWGGSPLAPIMRLTVEQLRDPLLGAGEVSEQDLVRCLAVLEDPEFVWTLPTMVAVWGRRSPG